MGEINELLHCRRELEEIRDRVRVYRQAMERLLEGGLAERLSSDVTSELRKLVLHEVAAKGLAAVRKQRTA